MGKFLRRTMHCPELCALLIFGVALTVVSLDDSESELDSSHVIAGRRGGRSGLLSTVGTFKLSSNRAGNDELEDQDSGELEYDLGSSTDRPGGSIKTLTKPQTKPRTEPRTEAPTFNWTQCQSEGGPKNCAKCKSGALGDNGALPCDSASVDCPDNKLWTGSYFLHEKATTRKPRGIPTCSTLERNGVSGSTMSNYDFPGGIGNSSAVKLDRNLVATKVLVAHPIGASNNVGVVMFKRMVMHQCTAKSAVCKEGDQVADVFKQGFCVQCQSKKYKITCPHCPGRAVPDRDEVRWAECGQTAVHRRRWASKVVPDPKCTMFSSDNGGKASKEQKKSFATQCLTEAFTSEGILKEAYQCSKEDMLYARASIAMFWVA